MANNVAKEVELYEEMTVWLDTYLKDKYKGKKCKIVVVDCHAVYLDSVLEKYEIIKYYPQVVGLKIEIDVLGMVPASHQGLRLPLPGRRCPRHSLHR